MIDNQPIDSPQRNPEPLPSRRYKVQDSTGTNWADKAGPHSK